MTLEVRRKSWAARMTPGRPRSVAQAVAEICSDDTDGAVERAQYSAEHAAQKLGALIEILHNKGILDDADLFEGFDPLLSGYEKV